MAVSNGGQTVYFQPAKVVRLNQQITNLKAQIRNLELAILGALTAKIYDVKDDIKRNIELITLLDMIFARESLHKNIIVLGLKLIVKILLFYVQCGIP